MIPILFEGTETQFTSNGIGRLADAISCKVIEERNATYELEMTYPITGVHYEDLQENRIILAKPFDGGQTQPFLIYKITKPLNGIVTVNAEHISYRLMGIPVMSFTANSCISALAGIKSNSAVTNPFTFTTDKTTTGNFTVSVPTSARELLCGSSGSILDVYGKGDYEFNRFNVKLWANRGADNNVTLRYGKNITDLKSIVDTTNVYTGISPYWTDGGANVVTLPEMVVMSSYASLYPYNIIKPVDFSERWGNKPTEAQLRAAAQSYVDNNEGWKIKNNITVSFVALWNTEEYKDIAPLERVKMCDVVKVVYTKLGVDFSTRVIRTDYNVLQERYNEITLGDTYYTLSKVINDELEKSQEEQMTYMQKAIAHATALITGGLGGYVVFTLNADGQPEEITIMDKPDITQAVRCIRMNKNGIGFSDNGYNGPFTTAWTIEQGQGHFVADYIDAGKLNAALIQVGRIQALNDNGTAKSDNYWDMLTGDFQLSSSAVVKTPGQANSTIASKANLTALDNSFDYTKVFNRITDDGRIQGITMDSAHNALYINASYIHSGILSGITIKAGGGDGNSGTIIVYDGTGTEKGRWDKDGLDVNEGKITGSTVQNAKTGARILIDKTSSLRGYYNDTPHNFINMAQAFTGNTQMTIDADTQLNIRTPKLCVINASYDMNRNPVTVYETQTDTQAQYDNVEINKGRECFRIFDIYKIMKDWPYPNNSQVQELDLVDVGAQTGSVHVTLPVLLEVRYKNERRMNGMVLSGATAQSYTN